MCIVLSYQSIYRSEVAEQCSVFALTEQTIASLMAFTVCSLQKLELCGVFRHVHVWRFASVL